MSPRFHGLTSLLWISGALAVGFGALFATAWPLGAAYLVLCVAAFGVIIGAFCARCPCRTHCAHVVPGWLAHKFTHRASGPFTQTELLALGAALLAMLGLPLIALWHYPAWLLVYVALIAVALVQIRAFVCRACANIHCPLKDAQHPAA